MTFEPEFTPEPAPRLSWWERTRQRLAAGRPGPASPGRGRLVRRITLSNTQGREIHAVTVGDYFKYRGTVEFMESLARANAGGFLALSE